MKNFEFEESTLVYEKQEIKHILELSRKINTSEASDEIINWLTKNVPNFIDNHAKSFKIDIIIEENSEDDFKQLKQLQKLYRSVPDESTDEVIDCTNELNKITDIIHEKMNASDKLKDLYKEMAFFYELVGIKNGNLLTREITGSVAIVEFVYDMFEVGVFVLESTNKSIKKYTVPEGFSIGVEISFIDKSKSFSMF